MTNANFAALTAAVEAAPIPDQRLEALLHGLADRIKATSNDQNIQKLSRELRAAAPDLIRAATGIMAINVATPSP